MYKLPEVHLMLSATLCMGITELLCHDHFQILTNSS